MRDTFIALSLGVPLMIYSIVVGEMTVETNLERMSWLVVGILTFGVMYFSGKHFYVGAWKSFKNHSANMDTLIALGTGTAWVYSMVVVFAPDAVPLMARHVYFEATAMIIGLIDLGLALNPIQHLRNMYANGSLSVLDDGSIVAYNPNAPAGKPLISFNQSADFETLKGPMAPKGSSKLRKLTLAGLGVLGGGAAEAAEAGLMIGEKAGLGFGESVAATGAGLGAIKYTMPTVWNTIKKVASRVATPWAVSDLVLGGMNAENAMVRRQNPEEMGVNSYMRNMGVLRPEAQKEFGF
jgi:hypothetical protein